MNKIQQMIESLTEAERQKLLVELLIPVLTELEGERCVMDHDNKIVGWVMSDEHFNSLIPGDLVNQLEEIRRMPRRSVKEIMADIKTRQGAAV